MTLQYSSFGSYILFKEIFADELGHLYRAAEFDKTGIKRSTFVRVFDGKDVPHEDVIGRLDTANRVAGVLHAANVAGNASYVSEDGVAAVAWDFVSAQPLGAVFRKVRDEGFPVPVDNALLILEKLSLALSAGLAVELDGSPLVHGFLHPGLVVVSTDGEGVVAGFGMADQLLGLLDDPESAAGCAPYLAPEILMTRTVSKRGDVYSLGAILFQLLTGHPLPVDAAARAGVLDSAELAYDGEPIPDDIKTLLARALAERPEERFSSAADFKKELDKLLYGGAYSPTTFNLALFMDRLFRGEIEIEEKEKLAENQVDVAPYLKPEPEPEPDEIDAQPAAAGGGKGMWIGIAAAVVAVAIVAAVLIPRLMGPSAPVGPPTPTPEERAAQEQAEKDRLEALVAARVEAELAEQEAKIREELKGRQKRIEDLQKQLQEAEHKGNSGAGPSAEEQRRAADLKRQIAAAEEAKRKREAELESQRKKAAEEARRQAEEEQARRKAEQEAKRLAEQEAAQQQAPTPTRAPQMAQVQPTPAAQGQPAAAGAVTENSFVKPSEVDIPPELLKMATPEWSRMASRSKRRGVVIIQATVDATGQVVATKVLRADEDSFNIPEAATAAAKECIFKPGVKGDVKIKTYATLTFPYNFSRGR